jgi:hypothetical protein
MLGTLLKLTFPGTRRAAAIRGSAAFLLHPMVTEPERSWDFSIWNISKK